MEKCDAHLAIVGALDTHRERIQRQDDKLDKIQSSIDDLRVQVAKIVAVAGGLMTLAQALMQALSKG